MVEIEMDSETTTEVTASIAAGATTSEAFAVFSATTGAGAYPRASPAQQLILGYYAGEMVFYDGRGIVLPYHIYNGFPAPFYDIESQ